MKTKFFIVLLCMMFIHQTFSQNSKGVFVDFKEMEKKNSTNSNLEVLLYPLFKK